MYMAAISVCMHVFLCLCCVCKHWHKASVSILRASAPSLLFALLGAMGSLRALLLQFPPPPPPQRPVPLEYLETWQIHITDVLEWLEAWLMRTRDGLDRTNQRLAQLEVAINDLGRRMDER